MTLYAFLSLSMNYLKICCTGGYGYVFLAQDQEGELGQVVVKRMSIDAGNTMNLALARNEIQVLSGLPLHPNIVRLLYHQETKDQRSYNFALVMEYCNQGSVIDRIIEQEKQSSNLNGTILDTGLIMLIVYDICQALKLLHGQKTPIAHRDLKVENMLLHQINSGVDDPQGGLICKLCDFGSCSSWQGRPTSSSEVQRLEDIFERTTTLHYRPPEMVDIYSRMTISTKVDTWSLGCAIFKMMYGKTPFEDIHGEPQRMAIINRKIQHPDAAKSGDQGEDNKHLLQLVEYCLTWNPDDRPSIDEVINKASELFPRCWPKSMNERGSLQTGKTGYDTRRTNRNPGTHTVPNGRERKGSQTGAAVVEAVQTRVMQMMGGENEKRRWLIKATSGIKPGPPKLKYVRRIVVDIFENRNAHLYYNNLKKLPVTSNAVVAAKSCALLLRVWQQGPEDIIYENKDLRQFLQMLKESWDTYSRESSASTQSDLGFAGYIHSFSSFLTQKLSFHLHHTELTPQYTCFGGIPGIATVRTQVTIDHTSVNVDTRLPPSTIKVSTVSTFLSLLGASVGFLNQLCAVVEPAVSQLCQLATKGTLKGNTRANAIFGKMESCAFGAIQPVLRETWNIFRTCLSMLLVLRSAATTNTRDEVELPEIPNTNLIFSLCSQLESYLDSLRRCHGCIQLAISAGAHPCLDALDGLMSLPEKSPFEDSAATVSFLSSRARDETGGCGAGMPNNSIASTTSFGQEDICSDEGIPGVNMNVVEEFEYEEEMSDADEGDTFPSIRVNGKVSCSASEWRKLPVKPLKTESKCRQFIHKLESSDDQLNAVVQSIHSLQGNNRCAECGAHRPKWMSVNLGVLLCLQCSGAHRQVGVHVSQVRSLTLDKPRKEWIKRIIEIGNIRSNGFWEAAINSRKQFVKKKLPVPPDVDKMINKCAQKPDPNSPMQHRIDFVTDKYVYGKLVAPIADPGKDAPHVRVEAGEPLSRYLLKAENETAVLPANDDKGNTGADERYDSAPMFAQDQGILPTRANKDDQDDDDRFVEAWNGDVLESLGDDEWPPIENQNQDVLSGISMHASSAFPRNASENSRREDTIENHSIDLLSSPGRTNQDTSMVLHPLYNDAVVPQMDWANNRHRQSQASSSDHRFHTATEDHATHLTSSNGKADCQVTETTFHSMHAGIQRKEVKGEENRKSLSEKLQMLWTRDVEVSYSEITLYEKIGAGGFAEVFRGEYRGTNVAVKRLLTKPDGDSEKAIQDFKSEVGFMTRLRHPNIVLFMGIVPNPLCLVTEYCARGNLFDILHNSDVKLSWTLRKQMALDAARGMNFLHTSTPVIIHRDLKSLNLLVDDRWTVKVSDFGLSRFKGNSSSSLYTAQCGTFHWMAPEVIAGHRYTEKADVFSYGVNLWELLTRDTPYKDMQPMQVGLAVLNRGLRPHVPEDTPEDYAALMRACWNADPVKRPSFSQIIPALQSMLR